MADFYSALMAGYRSAVDKAEFRVTDEHVVRAAREIFASA
jgi:hypothetical protein